MIKDGLRKAEQFDSTAEAEAKRRKNAEHENLQLRRLLKEKLQKTSSSEKRTMLLQRYEKIII